jgi:hypothetical protein
MRNKVILLMLCLLLTLFPLVMRKDAKAYSYWEQLEDFGDDKEKAQALVEIYCTFGYKSAKLWAQKMLASSGKISAVEGMAATSAISTSALPMLLEELQMLLEELRMLLEELAELEKQLNSGELDQSAVDKLEGKIHELEDEIHKLMDKIPKMEDKIHKMIQKMEAEEISRGKLMEEEMEEHQTIAELLSIVSDYAKELLKDEELTEEEKAQGLVVLLRAMAEKTREAIEEAKAQAERLVMLLRAQAEKTTDTMADELEAKIKKQEFVKALLLEKYGGAYRLGKWRKAYIAGYPTEVPKTPDYLPWWRLKLLEDIASGSKELDTWFADALVGSNIRKGEKGSKEYELYQLPGNRWVTSEDTKGEKGGKEYGLDQLKELRQTGKEIKRIGRMVGQGKPLNEVENAWAAFVRQNKDADLAAAIIGVLQEASREMTPKYESIDAGTYIGEVKKRLYAVAVAITGKELPELAEEDWKRLQDEISIIEPSFIIPPTAIQKPPAVQRPRAIEKPKAVERLPAERPRVTPRPPAAEGPAGAPGRPGTRETERQGKTKER